MSLVKIDSYLRNFPQNYGDRALSPKLLELLDNEEFLAVENNAQEYLNNINLSRRIIEGQDHFARAFFFAKSGKFYEAWCQLESSEECLKHYKPLNLFSPDIYHVERIKKEIKKLQSLFPYKMFCSPEFITKRECNICNTVISPRRSCGHQQGKIYNQKICEYKVVDIEFLSLSLVENPVQKYSVPFATEKKTGKSYDHYDYSLVKYLFDVIETPFDRWSYQERTRKVTKREFGKYGPNKKCICNSEKKFKHCCGKKNIIEIPHIEFLFDQELIKGKEIPQDILPFKKKTKSMDNKFHVAFMRTS